MLPHGTPSRTRIKGISLATLGLTLILGGIFVTNTLRIQEETKLADGYSRRVHVQPPHSRKKENEEWGSPLYGMNHVIFFNAIPKTGCRSIARAAAILSAKQQQPFNIAIIPENILSNDRKIRQFVGNMAPPAIVGGHATFVPFPDDSPVRYVNVMRDPLERLVSHYYFEQNGDILNVNFLNMAESDKLTLDDCILDTECKRTRYDKILLTTLNQLCGTRPPCGTLSKGAMLKAKSNLDNYAMIGLTEDMNTTVLLLEKTFPTMMEGLHLNFRQSERDSLRRFQTMGKLAPSLETVKILQRDLALEYELYDEVKRRFHELKAKLEL